MKTLPENWPGYEGYPLENDDLDDLDDPFQNLEARGMLTTISKQLLEDQFQDVLNRVFPAIPITKMSDHYYRTSIEFTKSGWKR